MPWRKRLLQAALALYALATAFLLVHTCWHVVTGTTNVPYRDDWTFVELLDGASRGESLPQGLWAPHWGHRPVIARLLFLLNAKLFALAGMPMIVLILLVQALHVGLVSYASHGLLGRANRALFAALVTAYVSLLFCSLQIENFIWSWQVQFVLVYAAAAAAFFCVALLAHRKAQGGKPSRVEGWLILLAVTCGAIASFSMANGILVWPLLLLLALGLKLRVVAVSVAVCGVAAGGVFFAGYVAEMSGMGLGAAALSPLSTLWLTAMFMGGVVNQKFLSLSVVVGCAGLLSIGYFGWLFVRRAEVRTPFFAFHLWSAVFALVSSLAIVVTRLSPELVAQMQQIGLPPVPSRYLTPPLLFWANLAPLALDAFWVRRRSLPAMLVLGTIIAAMGPGTLVWQLRNSKEFKSFFRQNDAAAAALIVGVDDREALQGIHPLANEPLGGYEAYLTDLSVLLRRQGLAFFAEPRAEWPGMKLREGFVIRSDACLGEVEQIEQLPGGLKLRGWVWDGVARNVPRDLVIADCRGTIVGLARSGVRRADIKRRAGTIAHGDPGWLGYAKAAEDVSSCPVEVYAVVNPGAREICAMPPGDVGSR
ncbi:MAG: hypothetical protein O2968_10640 [Acidobacteria bacterium]|nr:hypothetical protein [Acidobacteriota bacterium]